MKALVVIDFNNIAHVAVEYSVDFWKQFIRLVLNELTGYMKVDFAVFASYPKLSPFSFSAERLRDILRYPQKYDINSGNLTSSLYFSSVEPRFDDDGEADFNKDDEIVEYIRENICDESPYDHIILLSGDGDFYEVLREARNLDFEISVFAFSENICSAYEYLDINIYNTDKMLNVKKIRRKQFDAINRWEVLARTLFNPPSFYPSRQDFLIFYG